MAMQTSSDNPAPLRVIAQAVAEWVNRLGMVWIEGQVTQVSRRPGTGVVFLTLRDTSADVSMSVTCYRRVFDATDPPLADGARVVVHAKPDFYVARGTLSLRAEEIRQVGIGELLARIEQLKRTLAAEGLFDTERKRRLPFLPRTIGLVCGRGSAAERDVLENARRRWPAARFRVLTVAVQGVYAVSQVSEAVVELDADPDVDVIVIARGGGSVEDLLPFSDERLIRTVADCKTPVVSAIGHEPDSPLLDLVADLRASTPTDAAKKVVPDVGEEVRRITELRQRARHVLHVRLEREQEGLSGIRSRPSLAEPSRMVDIRAAEIAALRDRARIVTRHLLDRADSDLAHTRARVTALSPAATLQRGYAVLQRIDGTVVRAPDQVDAGEDLRARLAEGRLSVMVTPASTTGMGDGP